MSDDFLDAQCRCGRIMLDGTEVSRNWNPDCPVHPWDERLQAQADSAVEWQRKAREARARYREARQQ